VRELDTVFLGEVKYTNNVDYAATGLRELLEYMAFVRQQANRGYVESQARVLESVDVKGLLFVDDIGIATPVPEPISIVQFGEDLPQMF
jgi:hypothetical protein